MSQTATAPQKRYLGLKMLGRFFRLIAFVCLIAALLIIAAAIIALVTSPANAVGAAASSTRQGTIGAIIITYDTSAASWITTLAQAIPFLFWALIAYAASQVIDIVLSINDNLRNLARPGQEAVKELQQTADEMVQQSKRINTLLEQHHRRLDRLEKERNP